MANQALHAITKNFNEYADLLGEDLDDIEAVEVENEIDINIPNIPGIQNEVIEQPPQQKILPQPQQQQVQKPTQTVKPIQASQQTKQPAQIQQQQQSKPSQNKPVLQPQQQQLNQNPQQQLNQPRQSQKPIAQQQSQISQRVSQYSEYVPLQQQQSTYQPSTFQSMSQLSNLDLKTFVEQFQQFLHRHKQYQNYVLYLSENMREERYEEIQKKKKIIEDCHIIRNEIMIGRYQINLYDYLCQHLTPIKIENLDPHGEFVSQIQELYVGFKENLNIEKSFENLLKKNLPVKRVLEKKVERLPIELVRQNIFRLEDDLKYLKDIQEQTWTPLPLVQRSEESREVQLDNKDIQKNQLKVKFKRIVMGPEKWFYVTFMIKDINHLYETQYSDRAGIINYEVLIDLCDQKSICKDLHTKSVEVRVYRKEKIVFTNEICVAEIQLSDLFWTNTFEDQIPLNINHYPDCKLEFSFSIKEPVGKTIGENKFTAYKLLKRYPKLEINQGIMDYEGSNLPNAMKIFEQKKKQIDELQQQIDAQEFEGIRYNIESRFSVKVESVMNTQSNYQQEKQVQQIIPQVKPQDTNIQTKQQNNQMKAISQLLLIHHGPESPNEVLVKNNIQKLPKEITETMAINPEDADMFPIHQFILEYYEFLKNHMDEVAQSQKRRMANRLADFERKKNEIQKIIDNQDIAKYQMMINNQEEKHKLLIQFYLQIGAQEWANLVSYRLDLLMKNLEELRKIQGNLTLIIHGDDSQGDKIVKKNIHLIPKGLNEQIVLNPEDQDNFPIFEFLRQYSELMENSLDKVPQSSKRRMTNKLSDFKSKIQKLTAIAEKGDIQQYLSMISNLESKHELLIEFYEQIGLNDWRDLVQYRYNILLQELEGMQNMENQE